MRRISRTGKPCMSPGQLRSLGQEETSHAARDELRRALESSAIAEAVRRPTCAADCIAHVRRLLTDDEARIAVANIELLLAVREYEAVKTAGDEILTAMRGAHDAPQGGPA